MAFRSPFSIQVYQLAAIDGTTLNATTNIFTVPTGVRFYPLSVGFEPTTVTGLISVPSVSVGAPSAYNNILSSAPLTGDIAVNNFLNFPISALANTIPAATAVGVKITTGAVGTAFIFRCVIVGVLI